MVPCHEKTDLLVGQDMLIHKAQEIHCLVYGSMNSVVLVSCGWCNWFMNWHLELTLRSALVIKQERNEAILEGLQIFFWEICQHIIEQVIKEYQLLNIEYTGFFQKLKYSKVVVSKGSKLFWSKCADKNFHMTFLLCVSADKYVASDIVDSP